jgi:hypothetical protein
MTSNFCSHSLMSIFEFSFSFWNKGVHWPSNYMIGVRRNPLLKSTPKPFARSAKGEIIVFSFHLLLLLFLLFDSLWKIHVKTFHSFILLLTAKRLFLYYLKRGFVQFLSFSLWWKACYTSLQLSFKSNLSISLFHIRILYLEFTPITDGIHHTAMVCINSFVK